MGFVIRFLVLAGLVMIIPNYLKGIEVDGFATALLVSLVMAFLNSFVKPVLKFISFPITFATLGLFSLVITIAMVYLTEMYVPGFKVSGFVAPLIFSMIFSFANSILGFFTK
ncbi:phage holin family protein [Sandaracinomonas limnophila]|uniref:Phage holin family protein n=1 Tax=Sandaracinomonas limnophila TaxID=1862386 RepID=A0A437PPR3_9BACT|nr:phage holin family protein [Sandaracinomonas limnophila]